MTAILTYDFDQADWGSQKIFDDGGLSGKWDVDKVVIHYGGNGNFAGDALRAADRGYEYPSVKAEMAVLRIYEQSHLSRGWRAIGYNYAVGQSGKIYRLRGENASGATSGDFDNDGIPENNEARAILWIGGLGQTPTEAALRSIAQLIADDPRLVTVHSDHKSTGCPGDPLREWALRRGWEDYAGQVTTNPDFQQHWDDAVATGFFSSFTHPTDIVTAEKLAVFFGRVGFFDEL